MNRHLICTSFVMFFGACLSASEVRVWGTTNTVYYTTAEQAAMYTVPAGLTDVTQVAVCDKSIAALRATGEVVVWGAAGQPTLTVPMLARSGVTQITASSIYTFHALRSDGTVVSWGDPSESTSTSPVGLTNVVKVHGGVLAAIAIKADGTVVGWGDSFVNPAVGFTCQDAYPNALAMQANSSLSHWDPAPAKAALNIPAGLTAAALFTNGSLIAGAVSTSGAVTMWGPSTASHLNVPAGLTGIDQLAIGNDHVVARGTNGTLTMWGDGVTQQPEVAVPSNLAHCLHVAVGFRISVAVIGVAPTAIALAPATVQAGSIAGTTVGTLSATDGDVTDSHTFSFVSGSGDTDNGLFAITQTRLAVGGSTLSRSAVSPLNIRVRATDREGYSIDQALNVTVSPVPSADDESSKGIFGGGCGIGSGMAVLIAALVVAFRLVTRVR